MPTEETKQDLNWRRYPSLEQVFSSGNLPEFMAACGETCRQLDQLTQGADAAEATRAKSVITAYGHTLQLLNRIAERVALESGEPA